ncbi:hypothetical protein AAVH_03145 [Aphelenchoides avenae]|nr:hypothetical protein AAVH_21475 [Aphelenchus avenae]KAH7729670.1 hypothetical protein AAVH_03145 [Aphelenchus avenae]
MTAWWISEFGYVSGNNEVEKRPAGTFVRMARAVDYDPHATVQVTLATLADASALTKLATLLHHTDATLKVRAIRKVSPLTAEFFYGHRCEELEKVKACKKSVIHRRSAEDTTFYVVGRLDDVHAIEKRFRTPLIRLARLHSNV